MAGKKRKAEAARLEETDRALYGAFRGAANSLSQLYTLAMGAQKASFHAGERHAMVTNCSRIYPTHMGSGISSPLLSCLYLSSPPPRRIRVSGLFRVPVPGTVNSGPHPVRAFGGVPAVVGICASVARLLADFRANASSAAGRLDS
jgi:hypothetical protein